MAAMRAGAALLLLRSVCAGAAADRVQRHALEGDALALVQGLVSLGAERLHVGREEEEEEEAAAISAEGLTEGSSEGAREASDSAVAVVSSAGANSSAIATASAAGLDGASASALPPEAASLKERAALLEAAKQKAVQIEDYDLAKELKREIEVLLGESSLDRLKALKQAAVQDEDFDLAKDLKRQIQVLENSTSGDPALADKLKAYYTSSHDPLPWGWRSARDPVGGMDYFWPVNDRSAVTWDRPTTAAAGVPPPQVPQSVVRTTTPPPPFEVRSADGHWSRCNVLGNGTKPGTYSITVRSHHGTMELPNVPGTAIRNVTSNATLLTTAELSQLMAAWKAAQEALKPKVGERLEVKTKSNSWVPCVVVSLGNETDTYNIHVPFAPVGHQDHLNVSASILRKATTFGSKKDEQATDASAGDKKDEKAASSPQTPEERKEQVRYVAHKLTEAYNRHKQQLADEKEGKNSAKDDKDRKDGKDTKDDMDDKGGKAGDADDKQAMMVSTTDQQGKDGEIKALLYKTAGNVHPIAQVVPSTGGATAFFVPDDGSWCMQGEPAYVEERLARLRASPLAAAAFAGARARGGACAQQGFEEGPLRDACVAQASFFLAQGHRTLESPFKSFLSMHSSEAVTQGLMALCD